MGEWDGVERILILAGRQGMWGIRNRELMPLDGLVTLRNASLEDSTWRTGAGAAIVGSAIGTVTIRDAVDFWVDPDTQRTLVSVSDGTLRRANAAVDTWTTLASGLTTSGQVPQWTVAGAERLGQARKAFHCDRVNAVRVVAGDGATATVIARPPEDWAGANQPGWLALHPPHLWGGGNPNFPNAAYRSLAEDHEDFLTRRYVLFVPQRVRLAAGLPYKGGLLVWGDPEGVWWIDGRDPNDANWRVVQVGTPGAPGPRAVHAAEDDVLWVDPQGGWHLISMTDPQGTPRASDLSLPRLGAWFRDRVNRAELLNAHLIWDGERQKAELACASVDQTTKNLRVVLDLARRRDLGERWYYWDRDRNEALFLRRVSGSLVPAFGDAAGRIWNLERAARTADGSGYTFEFYTRDTDLSEVNPAFRGRRKNLRFLQLLYDGRSAGSLAIEVIRDGQRSQTVTFSLETGAQTLPLTLPFVLGADVMLSSAARRLVGQATRVALRGISTVAGLDVSIAGLILGVELAA